MLKLVIASCIAATVCGQFVDPKNAKILKEQRFNAGDGRFGSAFAQEDGTVRREETTADGERIGQYSYIDQEGKQITVRYTAGKGGFRILEGDHVPKGATGLESAPYDPEIAASGNLGEEIQATPTSPRKAAKLPVQPHPESLRPAVPRKPQVSRSNPLPRRQTVPKFRQPTPVAPTIPEETNINPFINPADPTHLDFQRNKNAAQFGNHQSGQVRTQSQQQRQQARLPSAASVPACADCGGVNPFVNPADSSHQQLFRQQNNSPVQPARQAFTQSFQPQQSSQKSPQSFQGTQQSFQPTQQSFQPTQQTFQPPQQSFQPVQQSFQQPQQSFQQPQQSFQPIQQSFQQSQQSFQPPQQPIQQSFQPAQQQFQPVQQSFQPIQQQTFQAPQQTFQSQQETILPAFIEQPSQPTQQFSPPQPQQFQASNNQNNDFQGQLSLNRFQSGFNFDFSA